jgi:hypothetical protein
VAVTSSETRTKASLLIGARVSAEGANKGLQL